MRAARRDGELAGPGRRAHRAGRAAKFFEKKLRDKKQAHLALDRLIADPRGDGVCQADVIIEAIFEDLAAKQALFADIEARAKPDALLASNTSSLKLADIAAKLRDPSRLVGIHFFNPVAMQPLVEVVAGAVTAPQAARKAAAFVRSIDKLPLPVKEAPGFLVNAGRLGKKSGKGLYAWVEGKARKSGAGSAADPALAQRLLRPLLDATQRLVQAGVVADAELADAGVIFGTGFAPYTGGPMSYLADS